MSTHINYYTSTATRPATSSGTTTKIGVPTPNRPDRSRIGPAAVAVAALLVVGAGAVVVDSITESDSPSTSIDDDPGRSQRLVQESIDAGLAQQGSEPDPGRSQRLVQESIDAALAQQGSEPDPGRSQRLVQESIDAALAQAGEPSAVTSYDVAEANRVLTLKDLQSARPSSFDVAEANRAFTLKDLQSARPSSFDVAEANRVLTLKDLQSARPSSPGDVVGWVR